MLEAAQHDRNSFLTLTYGVESGQCPVSVAPRELSGFVKRLRARTPEKFRYFAVAEYGEESGRPHYHLALFGYPTCDYAATRKKEYCCPPCERIKGAWGRGHILLGTLEYQSAAYVAGYVVKKMTAKDDYRLNGRHPEFARMSLRPGIGLGMAHEIASILMEHKLDTHMIDVPLSLQHGTKKWPLGRYLRRKLRTFIGREQNAPKETMEVQAQELQELRESAWKNKTPLSQEIQKATLGRRRQIYAREKLYRKRPNI